MGEHDCLFDLRDPVDQIVHQPGDVDRGLVRCTNGVTLLRRSRGAEAQVNVDVVHDLGIHRGGFGQRPPVREPGRLGPSAQGAGPVRRPSCERTCSGGRDCVGAAGWRLAGSAPTGRCCRRYAGDHGGRRARPAAGAGTGEIGSRRPRGDRGPRRRKGRPDGVSVVGASRRGRRRRAGRRPRSSGAAGSNGAVTKLRQGSAASAALVRAGAPGRRRWRAGPGRPRSPAGAGRR